MTCVVEINGREAVPVRAIPYIEGWKKLSPDVVVKGFARTSESSELLCDLVAHHFAGGGSIGDMLPKEWAAIEDALEALEAELHAKEEELPPALAHALTRPEWLKRSIECLPSHCFVWRDEFEASYQSQFQARESIHGGVILPTTFLNEKSGDHELNFNPRIPKEMISVVFDGMPVAQEGKLAPVEKWPWGNHETELLRKLAMAAGALWKNYDPSEADTAPTNQQVVDYLTNEHVAKRTAEIMAQILRADGLPTGPRKQ